MLTIWPLSSLIKVFPDESPAGPALRTDTMLRGELYSFQLAYYWDQPSSGFAKLEMRGATGLAVELYRVELVGCDMPVLPTHDEYILRGKPGLFPDPLTPASDVLRLSARQWRSLWVLVDGKDVAPGVYPLTFTFTDASNTVLAAETFALTVLPEAMPPQQTQYTSWFHVDCIASAHQVDMYSPAHWDLIKSYAAMARRFGMNMILTPLFTLALDTRVGGERPTHQLVDVTKDGQGYTFGFERLDRWIALMDGLGYAWFEIGHLFTQWGAKAAPKIMVRDNGVEKRLFGWDTPATGQAYADFLTVFLPALTAHLKALGVDKRCVFHLSDEPRLEHMDSYRAARDLVAPYLKGFTMLDALSDFSFYQSGLVQRPVPANNHIEPFHQAGVHPLWTYYCISQQKAVPNRFIDIPALRTRILGILLYVYDLEGFLHWGYNFYYSQYSMYPVNPWLSSSADGFAPNGDAFIVYPGANGPVPSLRLMLMNEAFQDTRALQALEAKWGRTRVLTWLQEDLPEPLSMTRYPRDPQWLIKKRAALHAALME